MVDPPMFDDRPDFTTIVEEIAAAAGRRRSLVLLACALSRSGHAGLCQAPTPPRPALPRPALPSVEGPVSGPSPPNPALPDPAPPFMLAGNIEPEIAEEDQWDAAEDQAEPRVEGEGSPASLVPSACLK